MDNYVSKLVIDDKQKSFLNNNKKNSFKTPNLIITLFSFFIVVCPFLILWILVGDLNALGLNWLVPVNANNSSTLLNNNIFYTMIGITGFTIIVFLLLFALKIVHLDLLPFLVMFNITGWLTIISGLISSDSSNLYYIIIARFLIVIAGTLIAFFIVNRIATKLSIRFENINFKLIDYTVEQKELDEIKENTRKMKQENKTYIEIEKDDEEENK